MFYFLDILGKCVTAELTDSAQAQELISGIGPRYGVIETNTVLIPKAIVIPADTAPAGGIDTGPDYGVLEAMGITYAPLVVADVFTDYGITSAEVHLDATRYSLVTDTSGFVRDISRITNTQNQYAQS